CGNEARLRLQHHDPPVVAAAVDSGAAADVGDDRAAARAVVIEESLPRGAVRVDEAGLAREAAGPVARLVLGGDGPGRRVDAVEVDRAAPARIGRGGALDAAAGLQAIGFGLGGGVERVVDR